MTDPFKSWGIKHLSPSSINLYIADPAQWILKYLTDFKSPGSPAMWRGTVVDSGIGKYYGLHENQPSQKSITTCQEDAQENMMALLDLSIKNKEYEGDDDEMLTKFRKEYGDVPAYIRTAINYYDTLTEKPVGYQEKVIYEAKGLSVPILGYIDLTYEDTIRDIKTTGRKVSEVSNAIQRQVSLYGYVKGCVPIVDYVLVQKNTNSVSSHTIVDVKANTKVLEQGANGIKNLLSISDDINDLIALFVPNFDDWRWDKVTTKAGKSLWSIK